MTLGKELIISDLCTDWQSSNHMLAIAVSHVDMNGGKQTENRQTGNDNIHYHFLFYFVIWGVWGVFPEYMCTTCMPGTAGGQFPWN